MKQNELKYTINDKYFIIIRVRKCHNMFMLKLMHDSGIRLEERCCTRDEYSDTLEFLKGLVQDL